ncbi:hypothetical protein CYMTET_13883 [Cymbomonas tetramitiformis]|uniref:Uncharacterized protein n=1 Tax=Cymbomonas tetramitiformis TaxID=36881 RepID=A0AAE0LAF6_9CHLO|nr:hypothetical protein CYMTET_13883 [Cymbomonas tetramitiformis]
MANKFAARLEDARTKLELAQQRQRHQFDQWHTTKWQLGDLVWVDTKHLTKNITNRESFRKLGPRGQGPSLPITERFFSNRQRELPEIDRGALMAYKLKFPPKWRIHDVFAQHRLKEYKTRTSSKCLLLPNY